jgi:hypothetical protein
MKSSYEVRWGHPRYKHATKHRIEQERKRKEAEERNSKYKGE